MLRLRASRFVPVLGILTGFAASAAELPSRNAKPATPEKMQTCDIDGQPGFKLPGGETCMRISGYVSAGVTAAKPH
jgi:hypothetical protein